MKSPKEVFKDVFNFLGMQVADEKLDYAIKDATKEKIDSLVTDSNAMDKFSAYNHSHYKTMKDRFGQIYSNYINSQLDAFLK